MTMDVCALILLMTGQPPQDPRIEYRSEKQCVEVARNLNQIDQQERRPLSGRRL
jgi:hypothetical protein